MQTGLSGFFDRWSITSLPMYDHRACPVRRDHVERTLEREEKDLGFMEEKPKEPASRENCISARAPGIISMLLWSPCPLGTVRDVSTGVFGTGQFGRDDIMWRK